MTRLMSCALFALACNAARIAVHDQVESEVLEELSDEDKRWHAWGEAHIDPRNGEPLPPGSGPSALIEDDAEQNPVVNGVAALAGVMMEPGSRMILNNLLFVRRRRSRGGEGLSGSIEGPSPSCPDWDMCADLPQPINCSQTGIPIEDPGIGVTTAAATLICPATCNTPYGESHCIWESSPCSDKVPECKNGYRGRTECVPYFSYENELHAGCKHGGPSGRRVWCPHNYTASTEEDQSEECDECTEVPAPGEEAATWEPVAKHLRCIETAVTVGDDKERKWTFQNRGRHMSVVQPLASGGKWPGAVALAAAVHHGFLEWDTLASDVFTWWTTNASDPRSRVTFRHLMNFNSGFYLQDSITAFTHNGWQERCLTWGFAFMWTPISCAEQIYNQALVAGEPGRYFDYNSYHLQIAFGMVLQASGMEAREYLRTYLVEPAGMTGTYWMGGGNPLLSSGIMSTPNDHDSFLRKYLAYEILPKEIIDVLETETLVANDVNTTYASLGFPTFCMGHWMHGDCHKMGGMVNECVNRVGNYYIGAYKPLDSYFVGVETFAVEWIQHDVEVAMQHHAPSPGKASWRNVVDRPEGVLDIIAR